MATAKPTLSVFDLDGKTVKSQVALPSVFKTSIRPDLIQTIHHMVLMNTRQPYAVDLRAGYKASAQSWGTGRAVARNPRVAGSGTHRAGQGAYANFCRGGGMFNPTTVWRKWNRKVPQRQRRHAVASALAAATVAPLAEARGHLIAEVPEYPLVMTDNMQSIKKTKDAVKMLTAVGLGKEVQKCRESRHIRAGKGKTRNRKYVSKRGPLVIYSKDDGLRKAFRGITGISLCNVNRLNILKLAPGGQVGRVCIFTESAVKRLQEIYGNLDDTKSAPLKKNYHLPRPLLANVDLASVLSSEVIQKSFRPRSIRPKKHSPRLNPLKNKIAMQKLNPAHAKLAKQVSSRDTKALKKLARLRMAAAIKTFKTSAVA